MSRCCADCAYMDLNDSNSSGRYWCGYYRRYYPGSDSACSNFKDGNRSSSGCYITTIMVDVLGYDDYCEYLNKLRYFRDNFMQKKHQYKDLLDEYDCIGVAISQNIREDPDKENLSRYIFRNYIKCAVENIDSQKYDKAITIYQNMVEFLKRRYGMHIFS